ncbi:MAG: hypothetical protein ACE5FE_04925, partial [Acidiferrobacterales bacterium]
MMLGPDERNEALTKGKKGTAPPFSGNTSFESDATTTDLCRAMSSKKNQYPILQTIDLPEDLRRLSPSDLAPL